MLKGQRWRAAVPSKEHFAIRDRDTERMAGKKKGLGRGLDALLGGAPPPKAAPSASESTGSSEPAATNTDVVTDSQYGELREMPIDLLRPGQYQPRRDMHPEALEELAESIRSQGVMQPIVVRPVGMGQFEIIAGERRWRASQKAGLDTIPTLVRDVPDEAAIAMALIENIQREDLNPMEEAMALARLQTEFELTHQEIANAVGKSRASVTNLLRLNQLQHAVRTMLEHGDLEMGHARALLALEAAEQIQAAERISAQGMSVRQAEALVRQLQAPKPQQLAKERENRDVQRLEQRLSEKIGLPVKIQSKNNGKGVVSFNYSSNDELQGLLDHLRLESRDI